MKLTTPMQLTMAMTVSPADNGDEVDDRASTMADDTDDAELLREILAEDRARDDALDAALATMPTSVSMADACRHVAETVGLKTNQVNEVVEATVALAATQLKLVGSFDIAGAIALGLKKTHERTTMKGAKAAGKGAKAARIVRARPLKKFKDMVADSD